MQLQLALRWLCPGQGGGAHRPSERLSTSFLNLYKDPWNLTQDPGLASEQVLLPLADP